MTDIVCPLCGAHNPPDRDECLNCQAPLKASGFLSPPGPGQGGEGESIFPLPEEPGKEEKSSTSSLEQSIPDWLKETEASFLEPLEPEAEKPASDQVSEQIESLLNEPPSHSNEKEPAIDDEWLASLLENAGLNESPATTLPDEFVEAQNETWELEEDQPKAEEPFEQQYIPPEVFEKPSWVSDLESGSTSKLEEEPLFPEPEDESLSASEAAETMGLDEKALPLWVGKPLPEESRADINEVEPPLAPAELPPWLEAIRPKEEEQLSPSGPVEDLSAADVVTAGPLSGLRGVISPQSSAIRARKPPTYSIKLRVTEEQRARVEMMEELLANEEKAKPLPPKPIITSRHVSRLVIAAVLILPIVWMIITGSQYSPAPKPGNLPAVINFSQQIQSLPAGAPVLVAFDYEAGFSGEMNLAIHTVVSQLMVRNAYLTLVATNPSGPALAETALDDASLNVQGLAGSYANYTNLGYIPGGTLGLLGLAISPKTILPYSLEGSNVWATAPLNTISSIADFTAVILMTNDPATARSWIEQVGPQLQEKNTPLLIVTSAQAEPLILPYSEAIPSQVQGLVAGLAGGLAYNRTLGTTQPSGLWDALSIGATASVLVVLVGAIIGVIIKMFPSENV
jgi:hypothetical protein